MLLHVHRDRRDYKGREAQGRGAQDGHLDFHTAPEFCFGVERAVDFILIS